MYTTTAYNHFEKNRRTFESVPGYKVMSQRDGRKYLLIVLDETSLYDSVNSGLFEYEEGYYNDQVSYPARYRYRGTTHDAIWSEWVNLYDGVGDKKI